MKTTLDLPDDLVAAAKQLAARRKTTLKDLVTRSLRREIGEENTPRLAADSSYELNELGLPRLKKRGAVINSAIIRAMMETTEEEEMQAALTPRNK